MMNGSTLVLLAVSLTLLPGCPGEMSGDAGTQFDSPAPDDAPLLDATDVDLDSPEASPDANVDGGALDAPSADSPTVLDAGEPTDTPADAPLTPDAPDGGPVDGDMDGVPLALDCNDADPATGRSGMRACTNACGTGTERCTDGVWGACSAPTDCFCGTEGSTRVGACGNCGTQGERCMGGLWTATGPCFGSGECAAGMTETRTAFQCSTEARLCGTTCSWGTWTRVSPPGECTAGTYSCVPRNCACSLTCMCEFNERC